MKNCYDCVNGDDMIDCRDCVCIDDCDDASESVSSCIFFDSAHEDKKYGIEIQLRRRCKDEKDVVCGDRVVITIYDANVIGMAYPDAIEKILSSTVRELSRPVEVECTKTQLTS